MKPIATRLLLVFVSMVVLLSCAATVRGAEPSFDTRLPMVDVAATVVVQVSPEGFLEERLVMPIIVSARLNDLSVGESLRLAGWYRLETTEPSASRDARYMRPARESSR